MLGNQKMIGVKKVQNHTLSISIRGGKLVSRINRILMWVILLVVSNASAQTTQNTPPQLTSVNETISLKQRLGFRTNAVDWLLTIPNVSIEFDLGNTVRSKRTISLGLKYNWDTHHKISPQHVFNVFDARLEWRQYFRTRQRQPISSFKNFYDKLKRTVFTTQRENPRTERAYYWGIYAHGIGYSIKFGKEGKQGNAYGAGLSLGFTTPLYGYKNGNIDLEMGGSIGLIYNSYDVYTHDPESNVYAFEPTKSKSGHLVPYPIINDLRVAFVYRFMSVSEKYKQSNERRIQRITEARNKVNAELNKMRFRIDSIDAAVRKRGGTGPDSLLNKEELKQWKLMKKERDAERIKQEQEKLRQEVAASLGIILTDTLSSQQEKAIRKEMDKRKKEAAQLSDPKKAKKAARKAEKDARKEDKKNSKKRKDNNGEAEKPDTDVKPEEEKEDDA